MIKKNALINRKTNNRGIFKEQNISFCFKYHNNSSYCERHIRKNCFSNLTDEVEDYCYDYVKIWNFCKCRKNINLIFFKTENDDFN